MTFNFVDYCSYGPIWKIIDERWEAQLQSPLYAAAYFLNPQYHYDSNFRVDFSVKHQLYSCMSKLVAERDVRNKIDLQICEFHNARGLFGLETAIANRDKMHPADWWEAYGDGCPELKKVSIRILSLTCSSSRCDRDWDAFQMVSC